MCSECDTIEPNVNVQISVTLFDSRNPNLKPSIEVRTNPVYGITVKCLKRPPYIKSPLNDKPYNYGSTGMYFIKRLTLSKTYLLRLLKSKQVLLYKNISLTHAVL